MKIGTAFLAAVLLITAMAANDPEAGKFVNFYTPGVINPAAGTVELTVLPQKDANEFQNEWAFALQIVPAQGLGSDTARNLLGILTPSGQDNLRGLMAICRSDESSGHVKTDLAGAFVKDKLVNIALSWGEGKVKLYLNGRLVSENNFTGRLEPLPGLFRVCAGPPFFVRKLRVSDVPLAASALAADPEAPFAAGPQTVLVADLVKDKTEYLIPAGSDSVALRPVWALKDSFGVQLPPLRLAGCNFANLPVRFELTVTGKNIDGMPVKSVRQTLEIPAETTAREYLVDLGLTAVDFYDFNLTVTGPAGSKEYAFARAVINADDRNVADGAWSEYLGHHLFDQPQLLRAAGIKWSRSDAFKWYVVEPEKGKFDWRWTDMMVENARRNNVEYLAILADTPAWAASGDMVDSNRNITMSKVHKPKNLADWENYVFAVASRYKGKVKYYEIWNEVDWHPPVRAASFTGSTADYLEMLKVAYAAVKRADPGAKVLVSGFGYGAACDLKMPFDLLNMGAADCCDFYNVHSYQGLWGIDDLQNAVGKAKPGMRLWQTEQMWHTISDRKMQSMLTAAIFFWFMEKNFDKYFSFGEDFFFTLHTLSPSPVWPTLAAMQNNLRKCQTFEGTITEKPASFYDLKHVLKRTDGKYFTALGRTAVKAVYRMEGNVVSIEDVYGRAVEFQTEGKSVKTLVPQELIFVVSNGKLSNISDLGENPNFAPNASFEEMTGDVASGGLESALPAKWQLRTKNYDPAGAIAVVKDAKTGAYAMKITSAGKGRVYLFFDCRVAEPGRYVIGGMFKNPGTAAVAPYFDVFDRSSNYFKRYAAKAVAPGGYTEIKVEIEVPIAQSTLVFGVGLEAAGSLIVDDVFLTKYCEEPLADIVPVPLGGGNGNLLLRFEKFNTDLSLLVKNTAGKRVLDRITFEAADRPLTVSKAAWSNRSGESVSIDVNAKAKSIYLLMTASYVPDKTQKLGSVAVNFADGSSVTRELVNNVDLRDWFLAVNAKGVPPVLRYVSASMNEYGVFMVTIKDLPDREICSVTVTGDCDAVVIVSALSLQK